MASDRGRSASPSRDRRKTYHTRGTHQGSRSRSPTKERRQHQTSSRGGRSRSRSIDKQRGRSRSISKSRERRGYRDKESSIDRQRRGTRPRSRSRSRRRSRSRSRSQSPAEYRLRNRYHGRDHSPRAGDSRHGPAQRGSARIPEAGRIRQQQQRDRSRDRGRDGSRELQLQPHSPRFPGPPAHHGRSRWEQSDSAAPGRPHSNRSLQQQHGDHDRTAAPNEHLARRAPLSDAPPDVNSIHKGLIQTIKPFGVFIAIQGFRKHVLVHHSQVSADVTLTRGDDDDLKVKALEYVAPVGQQVYVKILEVSPDQAGPGFRVHGSMRLVDQAEGADMDPTGQMAAAMAKSGGGRLSDEPPEVGSIHRGEVKRVEAYGVFVALQGYRKYGLVHASQVANYLEFSSEDSEADRKKALGEVVEVGQDVWVKVVEVGEDARGPKIGCSMKLVDQADGTDLDPQNMRYRPRGEAGAGGHHSKAPIGASAGEVGKGGTIDWGYLQTRPDQFGSKGYDLLDEEQQQRQQPGVGQADMLQVQRPQQQLPAVGRGRGAVMPAWMTGGGASAPAAPGSLQHQPSADAKMSVEEALRIIHEAAGDKHKKAHKKHKKHKHKKSSNHKKSSKSSKHKSHKHKRKSGGGSDSGSSTSSSSGSE